MRFDITPGKEWIAVRVNEAGGGMIHVGAWLGRSPEAVAAQALARQGLPAAEHAEVLDAMRAGSFSASPTTRAQRLTWKATAREGR